MSIFLTLSGCKVAISAGDTGSSGNYSGTIGQGPLLDRGGGRGVA